MAESDESLLKDLNARIDEMIQAGEAANQSWAPVVNDAYDFVYANQLKDVPFRKGWERIQVNYLFPAMAQQIALMAQRRGQVVALPQEEGDAAAAAFWQPLLRWQYEADLHLSAVAMAASIDAWLHGFYVGKVYWEPRAEWVDEGKWWRGAPRLSLLRPDYFGVDPDAERAEIGEAAYVYCRRRTLVSDAVARWPQAKAEIEEEARKGGGEDEDDPFSRTLRARTESRTTEQGQAVDKQVAGEARLAGIVRRARGYGDAGSAAGSGDKTDVPAFVTITEIFFHDGELKSGKEERPVPVEDLQAQGVVLEDLDEDTWPMEVVRKWDDEPAWPHGRMVLRVGADTILNPKAAQQRWPAPKWPYVVGVQMPLPHHWRGLNGVEMALSLQNAVNQDAAHISTYVKYFGDPIIKAEIGAVQGDPENVKLKDKLAARAGAIWKLLGGGSNKVTREPPPPMSAGLLEAYQIHTNELQDQTGMQPVARGRQAAGQATAREIIELTRASRVRTSLAASLQDDWIVEVMKRTAWLDQRHMDPGTIVRILGEGGQRLMAAVPAESSKFDVSLQVTTALPYDQERTRLQMAEIFKALGANGYAVLPELLAAYEIENAQEVMGRIQAWQEFQAYLAAKAHQDAADAQAAQAAEAERARLEAEGGGAGAGAGEPPTEEMILAGGGGGSEVA